MEAIALIFTKFSEELIAAQLAALCLMGALAVYWLLLRKKKKETAEWVPAALVRAYLDRERREEAEIRMKLFGEDSAAFHAAHQPIGSVTSALAAGASDPALARELDALRTQLSLSDQRAMEFDRMVTGLRNEKSALEAKLREMPTASAGGATPVVDNSALLKEMEDLKARLHEYEVIEDDLANLKKFQKENDQLRAKVDELEKGAPAPAAPVEAKPALAVAPAPEASIPVLEQAAAAASQPAPSGEVNTDVLQSVQPNLDDISPPSSIAPEKSAKQKEEELLSEFEKMLAS